MAGRSVAHGWSSETAPAAAVVNSRWHAYRKSETGHQHVLTGELGEVQQQFSFRPAGCQDAEHIADRQPRTPHARLAVAHCEVNADPLKQVHGHRKRGFPGSFRGSMSQRRTRRLRADGGTGTCDGPANNRSNPNAILARERLELFSLGEGHHSETDVREACSSASTGSHWSSASFVLSQAPQLSKRDSWSVKLRQG